MKKAEIFLEYQDTILSPPVSRGALYNQACSNDEPTIAAWRDIWIRNAKANKARFGSFAEHGIGKLWGIFENKPCIIAGSGPSLKLNAAQLKDRRGIPLVSCLHNFHYMEELDAAPEFYVTLDAGKVTIEEIYEGGTQPEEWYWERTKDRTLLAFIATDPELLARWRGKIYFYTAAVPDQVYQEEMEKLEPFFTFVSNGGNVLGACAYISRGIFGANPITFVGADFCFSYEHKFHAWDSKYDANLGHTVSMVDVYGVKRKTWQTYKNFKGWFDYVAQTVPGFWINCTEGGCLGSYPEGNIVHIKQMDLKDFFRMYTIHDELKNQCVEPSKNERKILF